MKLPLAVRYVSAVMAHLVLKVGVLVQYGWHPVMDDAESGAEEFYQLADGLLRMNPPCASWVNAGCEASTARTSLAARSRHLAGPS